MCPNALQGCEDLHNWDHLVLTTQEQAKFVASWLAWHLAMSVVLAVLVVWSAIATTQFCDRRNESYVILVIFIQLVFLRKYYNLTNYLQISM